MMISLQEFLPKWRQALSSGNRLGRYWEGQKAVAELKRRQYLNRTQLIEFVDGDENRENHWLAQKAISYVCVELKHYLRHINNVRKTLTQENAVKKDLAILSDAWKLRAESMKSESPRAASAVAEFAEKIKGTIRVIEHYQRERWRNFDDISFDEESSSELTDEFFEFEFESSSELTEEREEESPSALTQERELDGRFQLRLAVVLRRYLPLREQSFKAKTPDTAGISLQTIARLIVLFLVCADLADHNRDHVKLKHSGRKVTVGSVLQKLQRSGLKWPY